MRLVVSPEISHSEKSLGEEAPNVLRDNEKRLRERYSSHLVGWLQPT